MAIGQQRKKSILAGSKAINWQLPEEYNLSNTIRLPWAVSYSYQAILSMRREIQFPSFLFEVLPESTLLLFLFFYSTILSDYCQGTKYLIHLIKENNIDAYTTDWVEWSDHISIQSSLGNSWTIVIFWKTLLQKFQAKHENNTMADRLWISVT